MELNNLTNIAIWLSFGSCFLSVQFVKIGKNQLKPIDTHT